MHKPFKHRRSLSLATGRQRSIFISYLKKMGYIEWLGRETIAFGEFQIIYKCKFCSATVESGQLINHYRHKTHYEIAKNILQEMTAQGELSVNIPIIS